MMDQTEAGGEVWPPFCGSIYPLTRTAGDPVICTKPVHDADKEKHYNEETKWSWW